MIRVSKKNRIRWWLKKCNKSELPRLFVNVTENHAYAGIEKDGKTLVFYSTIMMKQNGNVKSYNVLGAQHIGEELGKLAKVKFEQLGIKLKVYFDRGGKVYHGRVKAIADGARKYLEI